MSVEFMDFSIKVTEAMTEALIAGLEEAAGEIEGRTVRNSRQSHTYGDIRATELWEHEVDEHNKAAYIGSRKEAGYWEEFGTGEHALNHDGRPGWWVYIEGGSGYKGETNTYHTKEEAEKMAKYIRREYNLPAIATNGIDPNRPLHRAFQSGKKAVQAIFEEKLKGMR